MRDVVEQAWYFAEGKHMGQVRKYTGEPYFNHPVAVSEIVKTVTDDEYMIAAALLHDTVEDTDATRGEILREFGPEIFKLVHFLTDISLPEDGNRDIRKEIDRIHVSCGPAAVHTIKLADLIDNTKTIVKHDPNFAVTYMREKKALLEVLNAGDFTLFNRAFRTMQKYEEDRMYDAIGRG